MNSALSARRFVVDAKSFWKSADNMTCVILASGVSPPDPIADWEAWAAWAESAKREQDVEIEAVFELPAGAYMADVAAVHEVNGGKHVVVTYVGPRPTKVK